MKIEFTKMHGIGNDYIYIFCKDTPNFDPADLARKMSPRRFSVGADGIVLILPSETADFRMRMFNADGSEAEMCGNAVRCIGKYVFERGHWDEEKLTLETLDGIKPLTLNVENGVVHSICAGMGKPRFLPTEVPVALEGEKVIAHPVTVDGEELTLTCVSMGNPHAVCFVDEITDKHVLEIGPQLEVSSLFPEKANIEFVKVHSPSEVTMRVWERGSGETFACGTGAAAVLAAGVLEGKCEREALVHLRGGDLHIRWDESEEIFKTGPASFVFDGIYDYHQA